MIAIDFTDYLNQHESKDLLRFITCGSVDDGKSTLIGRLLFESEMIDQDLLAALIADNKKLGKSEDAIDFSFLTDGLIAEREQGITIDVAYRFFSTHKRKFIVADTPGHEQYTRNMATGASTAHLAVVLVDARKGLLTQTKRHTYIASLLGIKHTILAINKMDLVAYDEQIYREIMTEYTVFSKSLHFTSVQCVPISALAGDNITQRSHRMPWYQDLSFIQILESVPTQALNDDAPFRMPIQWVNRPHPDFRGFSGRIASGTLRPGQKVKVIPGNQTTTVTRIVAYPHDLSHAKTEQSISCVLNDDIDISRGSMIVDADIPCEYADQFEAQILWFDEHPMVPGKQYKLKINTLTVNCTVQKPKYRIDVNTMAELAAKTLVLNEIGSCNLTLDQSIPFENYQTNRELGGFILIDKMTHHTVAAGLIRFALRRAHHIHPQQLILNQDMRASHKHQIPVVLWFTGLSGAGKSTIANLLEQKLFELGKHTMLLDGDNIRGGLNQDLDFTETGRIENIRRVSEVSKLMVNAGLIVLVALISPFKNERQIARRLIGEAHFLEIFIDTPLEIAEQRDVKGLYQKARAGKIHNFTGIGSIYEKPEQPDIHIDTTQFNALEASEYILTQLKNQHFI